MADWRSAALAVAWLACATPASALVLDPRDDGDNSQAPADDPGWAHVGRRLGGPSVIYLGHGWVLTANHVGAGVVVFGDIRYDPIPDTLLRLENPDGTQSDLLIFRIEGAPTLPDLPLLPIARRTPPPDSDVVMIGAGLSRGDRVSVQGSSGEALDGFVWGSDSRMRWGRNRVAGAPFRLAHDHGHTQAFATAFDRSDGSDGSDGSAAMPDEAQAAEGDSGGAVFAHRDPYDPTRGWDLAGVMFTVSRRDDQPERTALYGDHTFSADLSRYRSQILARVRPGCSDGADNDADGLVDHPADPGCRDEFDDDEKAPPAARLARRWLAAVALACAAGALATVVLLLRARRPHRDR